MTFTAIDFETAVGKRNSICQVGIVRYENGEITDELSILVQPPDNEYFYRNIDVHGITPNDTADAPFFDEVWQKIKHLIERQTVVAHNGFRFDFDVLKKTLMHYGIDEPVYEKIDTLKIYGKGLAVCCQEYDIPLNHHDALSDARACGALYLKHLKDENI